MFAEEVEGQSVTYVYYRLNNRTRYNAIEAVVEEEEVSLFTIIVRF